MSKKAQGRGKKTLSPKEQQEKDLVPFQSISRTTALWKSAIFYLMSFAAFFIILTIANHIRSDSFEWDILSLESLLVAAASLAVAFSLQAFRKKFIA